MCTPMFNAGLFTIVKTWKQPKCPLTEEKIKKMWYIYTMEYYSAIKKNECHLQQHGWAEIVTLTELSQRGRNIVRHPLCVSSKM